MPGRLVLVRHWCKSARSKFLLLHHLAGSLSINTDFQQEYPDCLITFSFLLSEFLHFFIFIQLSNIFWSRILMFAVCSSDTFLWNILGNIHLKSTVCRKCAPANKYWQYIKIYLIALMETIRGHLGPQCRKRKKKKKLFVPWINLWAYAAKFFFLFSLF